MPKVTITSTSTNTSSSTIPDELNSLVSNRQPAAYQAHPLCDVNRMEETNTPNHLTANNRFSNRLISQNGAIFSLPTEIKLKFLQKLPRETLIKISQTCQQMKIFIDQINFDLLTPYLGKEGSHNFLFAQNEPNIFRQDLVLLKILKDVFNKNQNIFKSKEAVQISNYFFKTSEEELKKIPEAHKFIKYFLSQPRGEFALNKAKELYLDKKNILEENKELYLSQKITLEEAEERYLSKKITKEKLIELKIISLRKDNQGEAIVEPISEDLEYLIYINFPLIFIQYEDIDIKSPLKLEESVQTLVNSVNLDLLIPPASEIVPPASENSLRSLCIIQ